MPAELDTTNPRALINLVTENMQEAISKIPMEMLNLPDDELIPMVYGREYPSEVDYALRRNFWKEYSHAQKSFTDMRMVKIYEGVCSQQAFNVTVKNYKRLAFIVTEPMEERQRKSYLLNMLSRDMLKLAQMDLPIDPKTGNPDPKFLDMKMKLYQFLYTDEHGSPIQRIKQESINTNLNYEAPLSATPMTIQQIDEKLRLLESQAAIDITPEPQTLLPTERVVQEAGRVSEEFKR